jgi:molybdenum cofactor cytidylyltransferase
MKLSQVMRLSKTPRLAIVGAGGKTTALAMLAQEFPKPLVISTTTHLGTWQTNFSDKHLIIQKDTDWAKIEDELHSGIILITEGPEKGRLRGLGKDRIYRLYDLCEKHRLPLLLECDGARQLPIKAPGEHEPPIPEFVDTVVVIAGLSGLEKHLNNETVYNPEIFSRLSNVPMGDLITNSALEKVIAHKQGGIKNIPNNAKRFLILNQADTLIRQVKAGKIAKNLLNYFDGVIITELFRERFHARIETSAAIILAAGSSSRYGNTKQLLNYEGIPFITAVTRSAINAGLAPIVVVTGADAIAVSNALDVFSNEIIIIYNPDWQNGQSTSIRAGINTLTVYKSKPTNEINKENHPKDPGSAIFLLADQPQVNPAVLVSLVEEHGRSFSPVIAPLVDGQRGNPILFDKITFPELRNLEGDIGGRGIFSKFSPVYMKWIDHSLLHDVDFPTDYERLTIE